MTAKRLRDDNKKEEAIVTDQSTCEEGDCMGASLTWAVWLRDAKGLGTLFSVYAELRRFWRAKSRRAIRRKLAKTI
jgi:hypothetical protein